MIVLHEMISRIASRVSGRFLRLCRTATGARLRPVGTVQIKNLAAKYDVKMFEGTLSSCDFRIAFDIHGGRFILTGEIENGKMRLTNIQSSNGAISVEDFPSIAKRYFKIDPELWVKNALANALVMSGFENVSKLVVIDGEIMSDADLFSDAGFLGDAQMREAHVKFV